jgi:hypothetical protein
MTPEMRAFDTLMHILHPDPEFEKAFRDSVAVIKAAPAPRQDAHRLFPHKPKRWRSGAPAT